MSASITQLFADWVVTFAIHSTCALGLAVAVGFLLRDRWLPWQERLLRLSLWVALPSSALQAALGAPALALSLPQAPAPVAAGSLPVAAAPGASPIELAATPLASSLEWSATTVLAVIVLGCGALGGLWLLRVHLRMRWALRDRQPETDGRVLAIAADVARAFGLRQSPQVSRSARVLTPIAFGCLRPEVCLPGRARVLDDEALRAMLAHEVAHVRRCDPAWMWLLASVHALFWWQPLFLAARRRWAHLVELSCDAEAAARSSPTAVARCLLDVAAWLDPARRVPAVALGMAARPSALRLRVEAALREVAGGRPHRGWSLCVGGMSMAALTFAAPGVDSAAMAAPPATAVPEVVAVGASTSPLRATLSALEVERRALLAELAELRAEVEQSALRTELDPMLALLTQSLQRVQVKCQRLRALIDRRVPTDSRLQSR